MIIYKIKERRTTICAAPKKIRLLPALEIAASLGTQNISQAITIGNAEVASIETLFCLLVTFTPIRADAGNTFVIVFVARYQESARSTYRNQQGEKKSFLHNKNSFCIR